MAACTPSIHVFLGRPLFRLSAGTHSKINFLIYVSKTDHLLCLDLWLTLCFLVCVVETDLIKLPTVAGSVLWGWEDMYDA
jgi:hypothetical protein